MTQRRSNAALWAVNLALAVFTAALVLAAHAQARAGYGPFSGKVELVLLTDHQGPVTRGGRTLWAARSPVAYTTRDGETITVPAGMVTDLASVPRPFSLLLPPDGPWVSAALVHDFLYETRGDCIFHGHVYRGRPTAYTRAEADAILRDAMQDLGVPGWQVWAIYNGVRLGGAGGWGH